MYPLLLASLATLALASPTKTHPNSPSQPSCIEFTAKLPITAPALKLNIPHFKNGYEAVQTLLETMATRPGAQASGGSLGTPYEVKDTYSIDMTYCEPASKGAKSSTVQVLSHGLGFDKSYWSFGNSTYNYIGSATAAGYSTLSYSRLGTGKSSRPSAYDVIQVQVQAVILATITTQLRAGTLFAAVPKPKKVVHVGHSYGSVLSAAVASAAPGLSDAIVLTGFVQSNSSASGSWFMINSGWNLAKEIDPARFGDYEDGFVIWPNEKHQQFMFLRYPFFDPAVLAEAEKGKAPFTVGEVVSLASVPQGASNYTGKVLIMAGENDLPFCGGQCHGLVDGPDANLGAQYPKASKVGAYVQPNSGHGMNLHYNASAWYKVVNDYLDKEV